MRLNAPKQIVFLISVILLIVGLIACLAFPGSGFLGILKAQAFWITFAGGALLSLGCLLKGL